MHRRYQYYLIIFVFSNALNPGPLLANQIAPSDSLRTEPRFPSPRIIFKTAGRSACDVLKICNPVIPQDGTTPKLLNNIASSRHRSEGGCGIKPVLQLVLKLLVYLSEMLFVTRTKSLTIIMQSAHRNKGGVRPKPTNLCLSDGVPPAASRS